jgi:hypothetical protein
LSHIKAAVFLKVVNNLKQKPLDGIRLFLDKRIGLRSRLFGACCLFRWYEGRTFNWRDTDFRVQFGLSATLLLFFTFFPLLPMKSVKYPCLLASLLLILAGCTSNEPFRKNLPVYPAANTNRPATQPAINPTNSFTIETNAGFKIGYVEFDDQGWFWSHQQWTAVKNQIENEASNSAQGLTIIVFVHGWKNNADYDNDNVKMFRGILTNLSQTMSPRKVFGVYVGWRGLSIKSDWFPIPGGEEMTFYHRKDVAERIGHQGAATQVFTELDTMQEDLNIVNKSNNIPRTELVIIGHSFGGQLVYSAISQVLTERLVTATRRKQPLKSFGDLVVLVNPAFEASPYNNLISLATSPDISYPTNQRPVLAIFTSKGDTATGFWFPLGRHFSTWYEQTRPGKGPNEEWLFNVRKGDTADEHDAISESVGHDHDFITYDLNYLKSVTNTPAHGNISSREKLTRKIKSQQNVLDANNTANDATVMVPYVFTYTNYACILQPRTNGYAFKRGNPFLNVAVDKRIIHNHDDINNPVFLSFLRDFILFTRTNSLNEIEN